jgi:CRISPR/Cas system CSM-associated protein Csm3 (group 7 of RAMP superfamily)
MDILKIKSQIKSPYFNMILKISKSSKNELKSDFVKSSIKSLNTLTLGHRKIELFYNVKFAILDHSMCHVKYDFLDHLI